MISMGGRLGESKNNNPAEAKNEPTDQDTEIPSNTLEEVHDKENIDESEKLVKQSCVRWADIVKKGHCKRPVPPVMGGAEKHS